MAGPLELITVLGIDPGQHGHLCAMTAEFKIVGLTAMPASDDGILEFMERWANAITIAYLEEIHALPRTMRGGVASFKLGTNYGAIRMALQAAGIRYDTVLPRVWQTQMKCLTGGKKAVSASRARSLYPDTEITNKNADAILIAKWGVERLNKAKDYRDSKASARAEIQEQSKNWKPRCAN